MMVPRSFRYSSPSPAGTCDERQRPAGTPRPTATLTNAPASVAPSKPKWRSSAAAPATLTSSNTEPVTIPHRPSSPSYAQPAHAPSMAPYKSASLNSNWRKRTAHDPDALPPAVAALLAVTAIPPRRANRRRSKSNVTNRRISIEELISEWKSDDSLKSSFGSSAPLSILLEDTDGMSDDGDHEGVFARSDSLPEDRGLFTTRSASTDSMPSLEADDRSVFSLGSPSTPESIRSRRSYPNLKREKPRSLPQIEDCALDHPLSSTPGTDTEDNADDMVLPLQKRPTATTKPRFSLKSNLTTSLQSLKNAAINSISSFGRSSVIGDPSPSQPRLGVPQNQIDDMLWSHPFLFPRFTSEIRPAAIDSTPSHHDPRPLTFEEQEAPYQQALHAPYLAEQRHAASAPLIQMQTYNGNNRPSNSNRRRSPAKSRSASPHKPASAALPDPKSEAGRALLGASNPTYRQREVRENSDFLRVVVLEMNMRRQGKLEMGRARIWLPPREMTPLRDPSGDSAHVPKRWVGESAY